MIPNYLIVFAIGMLVGTVLNEYKPREDFKKPIIHAQCYSFNGNTWDRLRNRGESN